MNRNPHQQLVYEQCLLCALPVSPYLFCASPLLVIFFCFFLTFSPNTHNLFRRQNHHTIVKVLPWELPPLLSNSCASPTCHSPQTFFPAHIKPLIAIFPLSIPDLLVCSCIFSSNLTVLSSPVLHSTLCSLQSTCLPKLFIRKCFHHP